MATCRSPDCREIQIREGGLLSGGTSLNSSIKLGADIVRFTNLSLAGMNNPIPNLTTVYLDTPLLGTTRDTLEYAPSPGRLGQPSGYTPISTGGGPSTGGSKRRLHLPPPLHSPHPQRNPPTGRAQLRRMMQPATVPTTTFKIWYQGGTPDKNFAAGFGKA